MQTDTGQDEPGQVPEKKRAAGASPALYSSERVDRNAVLLAVLQVDEFDLIRPHNLAETVPSALLGGRDGPAVTPDDAGNRRPRLCAVLREDGVAGEDPAVLF